MNSWAMLMVSYSYMGVQKCIGQCKRRVKDTQRTETKFKIKFGSGDGFS
jgi:hypothetical protein